MDAKIKKILLDAIRWSSFENRETSNGIEEILEAKDDEDKDDEAKENN